MLKAIVVIFVVACTSMTSIADVNSERFESKLALHMLAIQRMCVETHPESKAQIDKNINALPKMTKEKMTLFQTSSDPYMKGMVDGAYILAYDKDMLEVTCAAFSSSSN